MSFGIKIVGNQNNIVIDDNFKNLLKIGEGSSSQPIVTITLPSQGASNPQIFVRPWFDESYIGAFEIVNDTTIKMRTNRFIRTGTFTLQDTGAGFDWVAFGVNGAIPMDNTNYGVRVLNNQSERIYDSRFECPRVQQVIYAGPAGQSYFDQQWPQSYNFSGWGKRPWICINTFGMAIGAETDENHFYVTTTGTSIVKARQAKVSDISSIGQFAIEYVDNNFSGVAVPFPGLEADISVLKRYND